MFVFSSFQRFLLIVQDSNHGQVVANLSNPSRPNFYVTGLHPDTGYMISVMAQNAKGHSDRMMLQAFTLKSDGLRQLFETSESALATNMDDYFLKMTPFLAGLLTLIVAVALVFVAITTILCIRRKHRQQQPQASQAMTMRPTQPEDQRFEEPPRQVHTVPSFQSESFYF